MQPTGDVGMKKRFKTTIFMTLSLLVLLVVGMIVAAFFVMDNHSDAVGIIGGADGPTAIFVARTVVFESPMFLGVCIAVILLVVIGIMCAVIKRK